MKLLIVAIVFGLAGCSTPREPLVSAGDGFDQELVTLDANIAATLARADAQPTSWLTRAQAADLLRARARLSGDWDDYSRAQDQLALAFEHAADGAGPYLSQAGTDLTLHRLSRVEDSVVRAERRITVDNNLKASALRVRGEVAMLRDGYAEARQAFTESLRLHDTIAAHSDLARLDWITGDFEAAEAGYTRAESRYFGLSDEPRAWFHLQRGLMDLDRGRYDEALAHYRDADAALPGYWLVHEHIAEVLVELGRTEDALSLYEDVVSRTSFPDLQDTYAELLMEQGDTARAQALLDEASATWQARIEAFPDASFGHAIGHYLITDPEHAVELASKQLDEQPSAHSRTALAQALLVAGRPSEAVAPIQAALASDWRHADTFAVAAQVFRSTGDTARADAVCVQAREMNPSSDCLGS